MRKCKECGAEFRETKDKTELAQFADHSVIHQPTPGQWTDAYNMIQDGKERAKAKAKAEVPD
jgi:3-hydroxy-3-methylglutaryl CoA synthase